MATFLRLIEQQNKEHSLKAAVDSVRTAKHLHELVFEIDPEIFNVMPGSPFSYWANASALNTFRNNSPFKGEHRLACVTNPVGEDKRFYRLWWEVQPKTMHPDYQWVQLAKGGKYSPFYFDLNLMVQWNRAKGTYVGFVGTEHRPLEKPASVDYFFKPGLSWPQRTSSGLGMRALPAGAVFSTKGPGAFVTGFDPEKSLAMLALCCSTAFRYLVNLQLAAADAAARSYEVGIINRTPFPSLSRTIELELATLAKDAWVATRKLDLYEEISHAFILPVTLLEGKNQGVKNTVAKDLSNLQLKIDSIVFELYHFSEVDRASICETVSVINDSCDSDVDEDDDVQNDSTADETVGMCSWCVGVAFGHFDWRLATGEREAPPEPEPFDPLPAKSPGMLPDGAEPFHAHPGILVDDPGHPHDLAHLIEEVFDRVNMPVPDDVRHWLQKDFFAFHLQHYSKSRRKAPIYWPLATQSGTYTLWIYYPSLNSQTLYTAINDFVEPKLKEVGADGTTLRNKGSARTRDEEKQFETLQAFELELIELRDMLLGIAQCYQPNHDDGVQITAAPLWPLFRHKPWQKVLKDTWAKLEKGDYDWAHLAMNYWEARVREKCKADKSLAIAHDLEALYVGPEAKPKKTRGQSKVR